MLFTPTMLLTCCWQKQVQNGGRVSHECLLQLKAKTTKATIYNLKAMKRTESLGEEEELTLIRRNSNPHRPTLLVETIWHPPPCSSLCRQN